MTTEDTPCPDCERTHPWRDHSVVEDPIECGICGDYTAQGTEVHAVCLDMLSRGYREDAARIAVLEGAIRWCRSQLDAALSGTASEEAHRG